MKRALVVIFSFLIVAISASSYFVSCGGGGGGGTTPTPTPTPSQTEIGPAGGTLTFANGVKLVFPPGAVDAQTVITIEDLPGAQIDTILSNPAMTSTRTKRFLGGFSATPDGLTFKVPVEAWIPVSALNPYEIPIQLDVQLNDGTYRYSSSSLEYDGSTHVVKMELQHFSPKVIAGLSPKEISEEILKCTTCDTFNSDECKQYVDPLQSACCFLPLASRASCAAAADCNCCKDNGRWTIITEGNDITTGCQVLGDAILVKYWDCPNEPEKTDFACDNDCPGGTTGIWDCGTWDTDTWKWGT